ncbi:hypothetical protein, unlikely [Trypanosoma brucei gambiense DAL972]|uniref:Uncharacterized protein n=1 Tax=Trypanosoma brucei gambiense (strain MHOM/CI/86/DAL972) TaxID=679716 RepID=C9ZRL9_TRYB9|nr:hypothetical protein, unlikely [Trypanosoma brucei gambiense DAL972]CBH12321.1 hypothetical protein, unlikely [Trypanosoma brucei gambiense DAL972]|eukprot:XP_011774602.1 hypothetical protein, unlikely [Trypanosoma brucei gambiense DAL972]
MCSQFAPCNLNCMEIGEGKRELTNGEGSFFFLRRSHRDILYCSAPSLGGFINGIFEVPSVLSHLCSLYRNVLTVLGETEQVYYLYHLFYIPLCIFFIFQLVAFFHRFCRIHKLLPPRQFLAFFVCPKGSLRLCDHVTGNGGIPVSRIFVDGCCKWR